MDNFQIYGTLIPMQYENVLVKFTDRNNTHIEGELLEYDFNILCVEYYNDYICNEYNILKYNMSLKQIENSVINYLYYIFNNISISKKETDLPCCNIYTLTWLD